MYGIRSCDTCRRALRWLEERGEEHRFHDLRADGLEAGSVKAWLASDYADRLVNRRSTTWRGLGEEQKSATDEGLVRLLLDNPTLIKCPVIMRGAAVIAVGFDPDQLARRLEKG